MSRHVLHTTSSEVSELALLSDETLFCLSHLVDLEDLGVVVPVNQASRISLAQVEPSRM
jgi:hypothetical protein